MLNGRFLSYKEKSKNSRNNQSLSFVVTRCHSLSLVVLLVVIRCITRCHSLSFIVICCIPRCHLLSFVVTRCIWMYHSSVFLRFSGGFYMFLTLKWWRIKSKISFYEQARPYLWRHKDQNFSINWIFHHQVSINNN